MWRSVVDRRSFVRRQSTWEKLKNATRKRMQQKEEARQQLKSFQHDYSVRPHTYSHSSEQNQEVFENIPLVTSKRLARNKDRPKHVRMLARDFMDDSLYNPNYGYFSKEVEIFSPSKPFSYNDIANQDEFMYKWTAEYQQYGQEEIEASSDGNSNLHRPLASRQLWHTPTELFKPYYGQALARYLLVNYKLSLYPYADLIIYEMGAGNGTLMLNILDYLRDTQPDVYSRTKYNIIEISGSLASKQASNLQKQASNQGHGDKVEIINKSIFDWTKEVPEPCFFIGLEVFDNFAHDVLRYDNFTYKPYQGYVVADRNGDLSELYSPDLDPWAQEFLKLRNEIPDYTPSWELGFHPLAQPTYLRRLKNLVWPFRGNFSDPEYIPTRYLEFLHVLKDKFPEHSILTSDFTHLDSTIAGYNSPVVQTVLNKEMIPVSTYMVLQGFFDILFPTDFDLASQLYQKVTGKVVKTSTHREFMETWAELDETSTRTGENPLLSFYQNAAFMHS
ncbi:hypothetical protein TRVA0_012S00826 [Trichomonascus vanleenenianus]|uniref:type II protein arginine methyltransferase n=1 Tax=Trichomonascus vanleenenianus TaxID=2268995 RepID=UPI003EC9EC87